VTMSHTLIYTYIHQVNLCITKEGICRLERSISLIRKVRIIFLSTDSLFRYGRKTKHV